MTTTVYTIAAPKDESLTDVELIFAEPRDERLQGRQSTAVKLEVKLSESLVAKIQKDAAVDWDRKDVPDNRALRIECSLLQ